MKPRRLPRRGAAPVAVSVAGRSPPSSIRPAAAAQADDRDQPPWADRHPGPPDLQAGPDPHRLKWPCPRRLSHLAGRRRPLPRHDHPARLGALPDQGQAAPLQRHRRRPPGPLRPRLQPPSLRHVLRNHLRPLQRSPRAIRHHPDRQPDQGARHPAQPHRPRNDPQAQLLLPGRAPQLHLSRLPCPQGRPTRQLPPRPHQLRLRRRREPLLDRDRQLHGQQVGGPRRAALTMSTHDRRTNS